MERYNAILFCGPPGSGKGTQCQKLAADQGYFHFSTGEMLRHFDSSTELGSMVRNLIDQGQFVSDDLITSLTRETLAMYVRQGKFNPHKQYLLLDGIPRNEAQVSLAASFAHVEQIILLAVPEGICLERIAARALREQRFDDNDEKKVKGRLEWYKTATAPLLRCYDAKIIFAVNGAGTIEQVYQEIKQKIVKKKIK